MLEASGFQEPLGRKPYFNFSPWYGIFFKAGEARGRGFRINLKLKYELSPVNRTYIKLGVIKDLAAERRQGHNI